jgi:hypothetical protein
MTTTSARWLGVLVVVGAVLGGGALHAQEILTNDGVVAMVKAGLSESLVMTKIRATTTNFDLRTDTLIGLKAAGVPERILEVMVVQNGRSVGLAPASASVQPESPPDRFRR